MSEPVLTSIECDELSKHEDTIRRGLNTFVEVGAALLAIRDGRLYRAEFGTFEDYCQERWGITPQHGHRLMTAAATVGNLEPIGSILPATESQARPLTRLKPEQQREAWARVVETAAPGKITAAHVSSVVDDMFFSVPTPESTDSIEDEDEVENGCHNCAFSQSVRHGSGSLFCTATGYVLEDVLSTPCEMKLWKHEQADEEPTDVKQESAVADEEPETKPDYHHVSDDSYEWYTPADHIEAARELMGGIDLDPASCEEAQANVKAGVYYTKETDGLAQDWSGRVWMNPPYCMPEIDRFTGRIIEEYKAGKVDQAVVLTNNSTDTAWFHRLLEQSDLVCLTRGRVKFWGPDGSAATGARQGQAIFYLGDNPDGFRQHFGKFGAIVKTYDD